MCDLPALTNILLHQFIRLKLFWNVITTKIFRYLYPLTVTAASVTNDLELERSGGTTAVMMQPITQPQPYQTIQWKFSNKFHSTNHWTADITWTSKRQERCSNVNQYNFEENVRNQDCKICEHCNTIAYIHIYSAV